MTYTINIDNEVVNKQINDILNDVANRELRRKYGNVDNLIAAAVKDLIYSHKDQILEMVVDRASKELVRKGLAKLLERVE